MVYSGITNGDQLKKGYILLILIIFGIIIYLAWQSTGQEEQCVPGQYDVNRDGIVDYRDAGLIWTHQTTEGHKYEMKYDMNCDGVVDDTDADLVWEHRD